MTPQGQAESSTVRYPGPGAVIMQMMTKTTKYLGIVCEINFLSNCCNFQFIVHKTAKEINIMKDDKVDKNNAKIEIKSDLHWLCH